MPRVLQFVADGAPGGGTNHVLQILRGLQQSAEMVLLTQRDSYLQQEALALGIEVDVGDFLRSRINSHAIRRVRDTLQKHSPDLVHCHGGRAAFFRSLVTYPVPSIYTVHGFHFARKSLPLRLAGWLAEYWAIRRMQHVIFVCEYDHGLARSTRLVTGGKRCSVIHNGIADPSLDRIATKKLFDVGFIGRMVEQKHPECFVEVLRRLPEAKAVMVGGGPLEPEVDRLIEEYGLGDRVQRLGPLGHEESLDVLSRVKVLLMTPRWEGLPLLPLEAGFLRVPVVSTDCGGIPEVIRHGGTGWLAGSEAPDEMAGYVRQLLVDDELRSTAAADAREHVSQRFAEDVMLQKLSELYATYVVGFEPQRGAATESRLISSPSSPSGNWY